MEKSENSIDEIAAGLEDDSDLQRQTEMTHLALIFLSHAITKKACTANDLKLVAAVFSANVENLISIKEVG